MALLRSSKSSQSNKKKSLDESATSYLTIHCLPEEVSLAILQYLHVDDLLQLQKVDSIFQDLIDKHETQVWRAITFYGIWPRLESISYFEKGAKLGNIEALIKLGVAYLYNEGFSILSGVDNRRISSNGNLAAEMFCKAEDLLRGQPFAWMFIRPPWALSGACCKECVFKSMVVYAENNNSPNIYICIAKIMTLLNLESNQHSDEKYLELAVTSGGSQLAKYMLWELKQRRNAEQAGPVNDLQSLRELREIAITGELSARLTLCRLYAFGSYGGYRKEQASAYIREFVQSSKALNLRSIYRRSELSESMRHILVDWLVEVAYLRRYDSLVLHTAINIVDRFLKTQKVSRFKLQLLGISAIVLSTRFLGLDIMTVREGAYLTDHTYAYEEVVRMMGEITACLRGKMRALTCLDYVYLIGAVGKHDRQTQYLAEYYNELSLQHSEFSDYKQGLMASACILLARLTNKIDIPWSDDLQSCTGYSTSDLTPCILHIHQKCLIEFAFSKNLPMRAVTLRYSDVAVLEVGKIPAISSKDLNTHLGVSPPVTPIKRRRLFKQDRNLIASPSRKCASKASLDRSFAELEVDRDNAATPTLEMNESLLEDDFEDLSFRFSDMENEGNFQSEEPPKNQRGCSRSFASMASDDEDKQELRKSKRLCGKRSVDDDSPNHSRSSSSSPLANPLTDSSFSSSSPLANSLIDSSVDDSHLIHSDASDSFTESNSFVECNSRGVQSRPSSDDVFQVKMVTRSKSKSIAGDYTKQISSD